MLTSHPIALAYAQAFELFARLYRHGLTPALMMEAAQLPELAAVAPQPYNADEAAASFYTLFGMNVFPYQSVFLDPEGLLGGTETARVRISYRHMGFVADETGEPADHLAHELDALAFLCQAEAEAWEDGRSDMAAYAQQLQVRFLDEHLLRWLPAFAAAVQRHGDPFYAEVAGLAWSLAAERKRSLEPGALGTAINGEMVHGEMISLTLRPFSNGVDNDSAVRQSAESPESPVDRVERLLADPQTDLDAIASFLLTPAYSGLYLSRRDISRLSRSVDAPHGFGERRWMLRTLLRSAAEFGQFAAVLKELEDLVNEAMFTLRRYSEETHHSDSIQPWLERLDATLHLLTMLETAWHRSATLAGGGAV